MADMYAVDGEKLAAIADAIRLKRDITDGIEVDDMPMQIGLIDASDNSEFATLEYYVTEYKRFETEPEFSSIYVPKRKKDCFAALIRIENNTSNIRAGIYTLIMETNTTRVADGKRVGGNFGGDYGCDIYPGCKIIIKYFDLEVNNA